MTYQCTSVVFLDCFFPELATCFTSDFPRLELLTIYDTLAGPQTTVTHQQLLMSTSFSLVSSRFAEIRVRV